MVEELLDLLLAVISLSVSQLLPQPGYMGKGRARISRVSSSLAGTLGS